MLALLKKFHLAIYGYFLRYFRTRDVLATFRVAHANELATTPQYSWPLVRQRQSQEIAAIKAGRLDIVDRKSWAWPWLPATINRLAQPLMAAKPYNMRRVARTPIPRRAINLIKNAVLAQPWDIIPLEDADVDNQDFNDEQIVIAKRCLRHPNNVDSFNSLMEAAIEDLLIMGAMVVELGLTPDPERPLKMWAVNNESIRIFPNWSESTLDYPHYAQMTGLKGERGAILFYDDELMYVRDNIATDTPFGTSKMEVAWRSVIDFLGVQDMSGRSGSDQVHKMWLWWEQPQSDAAYQIVRRHIQNDLEGQAKVSIIGGMKKPEVIEIQPTTEEDLLLNWQELLIRIIGSAFEMSAMSLGIEHDVNKAVGQVLDDKDHRSAVVPIARKIEDGITRNILHNKLNFKGLRFRFLNLDDPDMVTKLSMMTQQYSANALTPNEMRKAMGRQPLASPLADLTQAENMLINIEAQTDAQNQLADQQMNRQMTQMQQMQQMQPPQSQPGEGDNPTPATQPGKDMPQRGQPQQQQKGQPPQKGGASPASIARGGQPPSPKPMALPKFPIAGSKYTARQFAKMPLNQVSDFLDFTGIKVKRFKAAMENQEPGILETIEEEVKEFLEQREQEEEQAKKAKPVPAKFKKQQEQQTQQRYRKQSKRINDMSTWLSKRGQIQDRPGAPGRVGYVKRGGKPGDINPQLRQ